MTDVISTPAAGSRTTRDAFLDGRLTLLQPKQGPRAAIDALFLAAAIPARDGKAQTVLDAGTGNGIAALALCARVSDARVTGVDVQPELLRLGRENARINEMDTRLTFIQADVTAGMGSLSRESFDHAAANPPYFTQGRARRSEHTATDRAYSAAHGDLEKWAEFLAALVRPRGSVTLIHRSEALDELLALLSGRFGALTVYPLFPKQGAAAKRVIVQGIKGSRAPLRLLPGMVLHGAGGSYTGEANAILRDMAAIEMRAS